ncbi:MAG: outer membrane beta-barrel protein [Candidatus Aminicenantes bacterium]|nr:outer membrane beta-barrel protein [Candidatus Aminicenantes bacterium]
MKKHGLLAAVLILALSTGLSAAGSSADKPGMQVFGDLGLAVSDFEGLFFDAGFQYGFSPKLFGEFLFEYYFSPAGSGIDSSAWGLNVNGVYKHGLSDGLSLFGKAGVCLIHTSASVVFMGTKISASDSDIGFNAGGGVEYALSENMGLRGGATFKISFAEGETGTFFKLYAGFFYGL